MCTGQRVLAEWQSQASRLDGPKNFLQCILQVREALLFKKNYLKADIVHFCCLNTDKSA